MVDGIFCLQPVTDNELFFESAALDEHPNTLTETEAQFFVLEQGDPNWEEFGSLENVDRYLGGMSPPLAETFRLDASLFMEAAELKINQDRMAREKSMEALASILDSPVLIPLKFAMAPMIGLAQMFKTTADGAELAGTPGVVVGAAVATFAGAYRGYQFTFHTSEMLPVDDPNACLLNR